MTVLGIICEYNPFHNGHLYHLNKSKEITGSKYCVCVMSGNFIQRGEPALVDKWVRTRMALKSGVDLVIELPVVYAMQTAELFAYGSIKILDSLKIVDNICFGSESGDIRLLDEISKVLAEEPLQYKQLLKEQLKKGISFPQARENALKIMLKFQNLQSIISYSNNILGIEYLKALKKINSSIKPYTITRIVNNYNSPQITGIISSATSIRHELLKSSNLDSVKTSIPDTTYNILSDHFSKGIGPVFSKHFDQVLISIIRKMPLEKIKKVFDVSEGLENRIKKASMNVSTINDLIEHIKTKRYTQTRIQRILFHILLGIEKDIYKADGPQYIRVLGFNQNGKKLLNAAKKKATLPIITKVAKYTKTQNALLNKMLQYDIDATNLYVLAYENPEFKTGNTDFTHSIIIEE